MCRYWKKMHTCTHIGDRRYIEMCRPGSLSNTVCQDLQDDEEPRPSHFPCWTCIKAEYRAEVEQVARERMIGEAKASVNERNKASSRVKQAEELAGKEARVRRDAQDKAERERDEEAKAKAEREKEEERAMKEGGAWIETGSGKKSKGKKGGSAASNPFPASPTVKANVLKENEGMGAGSPKKGAGQKGRAGTWGPTKILTRKENGEGNIRK